MTAEMKPLKPYLLRAYYEWINDSSYTPYLLVYADLPHVLVPTQYIDPEDNSIVFNISKQATNSLHIKNHAIEFQARFDGKVWDVVVPIYAVTGLYAHENDEGILFDIDTEEVEKESKTFLKDAKANATQSKIKTHPHLRVIKNEKED